MVTGMTFRTNSINQQSDRCAMGLPEHHVDAKCDRSGEVYDDLSGLAPDELVAISEEQTEPVVRRVAAGQLAGLKGDPRIDTLAPEMIDVEAACVPIGLSQENVASIAAEFAHVGVLPEWIMKECPEHNVVLDPYRIAKYPVTNAEYRDFLEDTKFPELPTSWEFGCYPHLKANTPVYTVSPSAADAYAKWLANRTRRLFRLPTEPEWEHAAAGFQRFEYPWGMQYREDCANTLEAKLLCATPVGAFPAGKSPIGAFDMAGNVEEYVSNDYGPYPGAEAIQDDLLRSDDVYRVARGGSFTRHYDLARCKRRHGWYRKPIYVMGFRLAESVK